MSDCVKTKHEYCEHELDVMSLGVETVVTSGEKFEPAPKMSAIALKLKSYHAPTTFAEWESDPKKRVKVAGEKSAETTL